MATGGEITWSTPFSRELHKPIRKRFSRRRVVSLSVDSIWGADLIDVQKYSRMNKGIKYILVVIDIFSKYAWAYPLRDKTGRTVASAFESLFQQHHPHKLWVDRGSEFYNPPMTRILKEYGVHRYSTFGKDKSCVAERFIRTLMEVLMLFFDTHRHTEFLDVLQPAIDRYNSTPHRSIGCTPAEARLPAFYQTVFDSLYFPSTRKGKKARQLPRFTVGDRVRIPVTKSLFSKGYQRNWSLDVYTIRTVKRTVPPTYTLQEDDGSPVRGTWYGNQLQKTSQEVYRIEKVLRRRAGGRESYVQWEGYDKKYNSWIPTSDITGAPV